ncbi:MAG: ATP-binding protein [Bryobacteraceae bacterium]
MANPDRQTRRLLLIGFGGLILLLAVSGLNALSVLRKIQTQNQSIRDDYFNRDRVLEQLRSDIYLSGTYVRDLLLEQDSNRADMHRVELEAARRRIDQNVAAYDRVLRPEERLPFQRFRTELDAYFDSLQPALEWNAGQRRLLGYAFMKDSLLPRRMVVVHLADQISAVNQLQMETGSRRVASLFSRFQRWLIAVLALSLLCGALLAAGSIYRILRLEQISGKRYEETEHAREALRDLSARLIEVQESERRSLSRELHDEVGQSLSALLLGIGNVAAIISPGMISPESDRNVRAQLCDLRRIAEKTVAVVRDMSLLLRPSMLDDLGLIPAVQWQAREISRNHNIYVQVLAGSIPDNITDDQKTCIYRIVQETLRNTVRHAKAKSVRLALSLSGENLLLTIQDDGHGFHPDREKGLGLLGMEERVTHLGGNFHVESRIGEGTSIRVELPLAESSVASEP